MISDHRRRAWQAALDVCDAVRAAVDAVPLRDRAARVPSLLKPPPEVSAAPDAAGERAALQVLSRFARASGVEVRLVVDPSSGSCVRLRPGAAPAGAGAAPGAAAAPGPGAEGKAEEQVAAELVQEGAPAACGGGGPLAAPAAEAARAERSAGSGHAGEERGDAEPSGGAEPGGGAERVYVYLDAVDGTLLLSGLSNEPTPRGAQPAVLRLAGAGAWAVGVAMTDPTRCQLADLRLSDFSVAAVADGAACGRGCACARAQAALQPAAACAVWADDDEGAGGGGGGDSGRKGRYFTYDCSDGLGGAAANDAAARGPPRLFTSSCERLGGTFAYLDAFQALDGASARREDPALARMLFARLGDRRGGGAFDVVRAYGNLGALLRCFFGWRGGSGGDGGGGGDGCGGDGGSGGGDGGSGDGDDGDAGGGGGDGGYWLEPQTGAFVVVNENLANLIPAVPLVLGAGGVATDLEGRGLAARRLAAGRTSVVYAGNAALHGAVMRLARDAAAAAAAEATEAAVR